MKKRSIGHLTARERQAVQAFVSSLREQMAGQLLQATLFGSKARGDSNPWPDIDILIVVREENWTVRAQVSTLAADISLDYVLIGPRVAGQERWERMKKAGLSLHKNIAAEGVPLPLSA